MLSVPWGLLQFCHSELTKKSIEPLVKSDFLSLLGVSASLTGQSLQESFCGKIPNQVRNDINRTNCKGVKSRKELIPQSLFPSIRKRTAFTLAEVLITLGIIGVVAAMTIPNLMTKFQKRSVAIQIKKAYSVTVSALRLSDEEHGDISGWSRENFNSPEGNRKIVEEYLLKYMTGYTWCSGGIDPDMRCGVPVSLYGNNYILNNGVGMSVVYKYGNLYVLLTPAAKKNKNNVVGKDAFYFSTNNSQNHLLPFGWENGITREQVLQGFNITIDGGGTDYISCKKNAEEDDELHRHGCTLLLYLDNWEFRDDYPW